MTEFSSLGEHCSFATCNRQDFLPIKCVLCELVHCREHASYTSHSCQKYEQQQQVNDFGLNKPIETHACAFEKCNKKELVQVLCQYCKLNHCLQHRLQATHDCLAVAKTMNTNGSHQKPKQEFKFEMKTNVSEKNTSLANKLVLMKLKQNADGPPGLPDEARFYCFILLGTEKKPFYLSKKWPVGRCIEFIQKKNSIEQSKAHLKTDSGDVLLAKSDLVEDLLNQKILNHGMTLFLTSE
jgi:hypothetical protein